MIYLNKNTTNPVILELTSVSNLINCNYLFEFINDINPNSITYFTGDDLSPYKCRFNRFNIVETGLTYTNLTACTVNLKSGSYTYNVYESVTPTLEISATTGTIISTGKAYVNGIDTEIAEVYR